MREKYMDHWTSNSILNKEIASSASLSVRKTLDQWTSQTIVGTESLSSLELCVCVDQRTRLV